MWDRVRRLLRTAAIALGVAAVVFVVFGYRESMDGWCPVCWAPLTRGEAGLALAPDLRLPLWRRVAPTGECPPGIARFIAADHVHDADADFVGLSGSMHGPYVFFGRVSCGRSMPSEFALALMWDPAFSDYVAARVADGSLDVETVRRLIAVPSWSRRSGTAWEALLDHPALLRTGTELCAAYRHVAPESIDLWGGMRGERSAPPHERQRGGGLAPPERR